MAPTVLSPFPDGCTYLPTVFDSTERLYERLLHEAPWQTDHVRIYGKLVEVPRRIAMFGMPYRYSGVDHPALPWTPLLASIRDRV